MNPSDPGSESGIEIIAVVYSYRKSYKVILDCIIIFTIFCEKSEERYDFSVKLILSELYP